MVNDPPVREFGKFDVVLICDGFKLSHDREERHVLGTVEWVDYAACIESTACFCGRIEMFATEEASAVWS